MVFYRTNGDYVPAVLKHRFSSSCCQNIMPTGREDMPTESPNRGHAPAIVITSFQQENYCFLEY